MLNLFSLLLVGQVFIYILIIVAIILGITYIVIYIISMSLRINYNINMYPQTPLDVETLNKELRPLGFAYTEERDFFYSIMYPWQRNYGYCKTYDDVAPLFCMIIDSEPIYFNYDNKEWLIEFWKGQYGMTTGGEIGLYVSTATSSKKENIIYESVKDTDCLPLSYALKKKDNVIIIRNNTHWWLTGFKLGEYSKPSDLVMDITITFKDKQMQEAFVNALREKGYHNNDIKILSNKISLTFDKPHTKQPITKNKLITYFVQLYNKHNCKVYNKITKDYNNALDKLNYIRSKFPIIFNKALKIGKSPKIYKIVK